MQKTLLPQQSCPPDRKPSHTSKNITDWVECQMNVHCRLPYPPTWRSSFQNVQDGAAASQTARVQRQQAHPCIQRVSTIPLPRLQMHIWQDDMWARCHWLAFTLGLTTIHHKSKLVDYKVRYQEIHNFYVSDPSVRPSLTVASISKSRCLFKLVRVSPPCDASQ